MRALALAAVVAALILSACGASAHKSSPPATRPSTLATTAPSIAGSAPKPAGPRVGVIQRVPATGTTLVVDVTKVIDPLVGSGAKIASGTLAVGVVIHVRNAGPSGYDSSATSDFSLSTAAGHAMPVFAPTGVCQTFVQDFMNELGAGQSRTGCIAYSVPRGKPPLKVTLTPDGGTAHSKVSWVVR